MKKLNLLFTALLLMCCVRTAKAEQVTIDGIRYDVIVKGKQATIIGYDSDISGDFIIPSEITYNNVTCSVTRIENLVFQACYELTSVTIPNSVTSIGEWAFAGCDGLKEVHINDIAAWCNIDFEDYYANPLYYAHNLYLNNELLTELVIPNGVTSIGNWAFYCCDGLTSVTIPNSITSIGDDAFAECYGLTSITIPNSVTSIGTEVFGWCTSLASIEIPNSVTSIGDRAFYNCKELTSITIPNSVTSIGYDAFGWCTSLASIEIPNSVTSIGGSAFGGCSGLTSITIPNSVTSIESSAFSGCSGLTSITIPNSVTSIGGSAFGGCSGLTSITIPNSVTSIGGAAFYNCSGLTNITIPNSVTSIGSSAFYNCSGLTSITIPNSITSIEPYAFGNCENLGDVYCLATNVPSTNSNAFSDSYPEYMTLHVPAEAINSYKTTEPWSTFGNIIVYVTPKCAAPVIEYYNGELFIECDTKNAEFVTTITNDYTGNYNSNAIALTATYNISVYATATGYDNSDTVNATLCWIECDCSANDNTTDVINVPAKAVFVTSNNGTINISCALEGEVVELYTSDAMYIGSTTIENGTATIESGLSKGDIAIIKIAEKSIKVILN